MRNRCRYGSWAFVCALLFSIGCSDGTDFPSELNGEWGSVVLAQSGPTNCLLGGMLNVEQSFDIRQNGDVVSVNFTDSAGNQVTLNGTYVTGVVEATLTVRSPGDRVVVLDLVLLGNVSSVGESMLDGKGTVTADSDGLCDGVVVDVWMMQHSEDVEPEPAEALLVFVGHGYSEDVDVVDLDSMTVIATIPGAGGYRMVITPDGRKLYGTTGDDNFTISDSVNLLLIDSILPGDDFTQFSVSELEPITISPDGSRVYIGDEQGEAVLFTLETTGDTLIDAESLEADEPENAVTSPDGQFIYIADNGEILKINAATLAIVDSESVESDSHGVAISADGAFVYADGVAGGIDVIRTSDMTMVANIPGGEGYYLATSADGKRVYGVDESSTLHVMETSDNSIVSVDLSSLGLPTSIFGARGVTTTPDSKTILIATSSGLIKMDATTLLSTGFVAGRYQSVVVRPPNGFGPPPPPVPTAR